MTKDKLKNDKLKIFQNYTIILFRLIRSYFIYLNLRKVEYKKIADRNLDIYGILSIAIQDQVLIGFYEIINNDKDNKTVNVYKLLKQLDNDEKIQKKVESIINKNQPIKNNLEKWRNNICAHKNNQNISTPGLIEKSHEVNLSELDDLLFDLIKIADITKNYFDDKCNIDYQKDYYEDEKKYLDDKFNQLFSKL